MDAKSQEVRSRWTCEGCERHRTSQNVASSPGDVDSITSPPALFVVVDIMCEQESEGRTASTDTVTSPAGPLCERTVVCKRLELGHAGLGHVLLGHAGLGQLDRGVKERAVPRDVGTLHHRNVQRLCWE